MTRIIEKFGRLNATFSRGVDRLARVLVVFGFLTFAKVWQNVFEQYGIPFILVVIGIPLTMGIISLIIGYIDIKSNLMKIENIYINKKYGFDYVKMSSDIDYIKKSLEKYEVKNANN